jgi:hypothetical protein
MKGIHFVTDKDNKKIAVQIDLRKYGTIWEDFYDNLVAELRVHEDSKDIEEFISELKSESKLDEML